MVPTKFISGARAAIVWIGVVGCSMSISHSALARPQCRGQLTLTQSRNLEPISSQDLFAQPSGSAAPQPNAGNLPVLPTTARRTLADLWQIEVTPDDAVLVDYELIGDRCRSCLSHAQYPQSTIAVRANPLPVVQIPKPGNGQNCRSVTSGVDLILDLKSIRYAGPYRGVIRVTVTRL